MPVEHESVTINGIGYRYDDWSHTSSFDYVKDTSLTEIVVLEEAPEGYKVVEILVNAFIGCTALRSITLPATITLVSADCFLPCTSLETIYFNGTEAQWNSIEGIETAGIAESVTIQFKPSAAERLTLLANEVRELSGLTEPLSIDAMTTNISDVNASATSQTALINQIKTALEGKASSAPDGIAIISGTIIASSTADPLDMSGYVHYVNELGQPVSVDFRSIGGEITTIANSIVSLEDDFDENECINCADVYGNRIDDNYVGPDLNIPNHAIRPLSDGFVIAIG